MLFRVSDPHVLEHVLTGRSKDHHTHRIHKILLLKEDIFYFSLIINDKA